jgi:hypothetical protein
MRFKIFIIISVFFSLFLFSPASAASDYGLSAAVNATQGSLPKTVGGASNLPELAAVIVNVALSLIGILFFILMLYAGITWMKAMGNTDEVTKAKEMITQAIIGLVIIMAAYAISNFVFTSLGSGGNDFSSSPNMCAATFADGMCKEAASCNAPMITTPGLCPGGATNLCCHTP